MHSFSYTVKPERDVKQTHLIGSISVEVDFLQRTQLVAKPSWLSPTIDHLLSLFLLFLSLLPPIPPPPLPFSTLQKSSACNQHRWYGCIFSGEVLWQCLLFRPSGKHFEPVVKNYGIRIIVYWVLLKCTVFRLFSGQRRRFHCWKEQCFRSLVSLLCFSHYLPSPSPSKGYYLIFYLPCSSAEDVSGVMTGGGSKTSKKVHLVPDHLQFLVFFGVHCYQQGCKILPEMAKNDSQFVDLSLYTWTCFLSFFSHFWQYFASL